MFKKLIKKILFKNGYRLVPLDESKENRLSDIDDKKFLTIYKQCRPYTMTSLERMFALYQAVKYVVKNKIPGEIAECGVWRGGSAMLAAQSLLRLSDRGRMIYLYDTYTGMTKPSKDDYNSLGKSALGEWRKKQKKGLNQWCYASLEDVKQNLFSTEYPKEKIKFIKGDVKKTIPQTVPDKISLLRLDTDWYESTYHELVHLFPRLSPKGALIIDDYGCWEGARKAVDQYFKEEKINILLNRIDDTGRLGIR